MPNLIKSNPLMLKLNYAAVAMLLEDMDIRRGDNVKLRIHNGVAETNVKRVDGRVQSSTTMLNGRFHQQTDFNSSGLSPAARRKVVKKLRKDGHRQTAIADLIGVSQATVSLDLRKR
ncbi:hypothetical protein [Mesorhizobium sp. M0276]|uniref:hypothetical protein n=1 Tax=Mesorhizobium sp. M0276 TaxID=2956928 RepID=UPI00333B7AFF